ncbi:MAG: hypothetical protein NTY02_00415 [Acidobacteria bacterium]|nr:hypothetical protein [Acidobacteriota bacterium]
MAKKASWGLIILGIAVFVVIVGVGIVGVAGYVLYQQFAFQATTASESTAKQEFEKAMAQFDGQRPFLVIQDGEPVVSEEKGPNAGKPIEALHILVWTPDEGKIVRLNMPFWLLRMTKGRPIKLGSGDGEGSSHVRLKITAEDLERRGPGLILDHKEASGDRVLVWAQ